MRNAEFASPRWSPDGTQIAVVRRHTKPPQTSRTRGAASTRKVDSNPTAIVVVDVSEGTLVEWPAGQDRAYGALAWAGDDRHLVVTQSDTTQVYAPGTPSPVLRLNVRSGQADTLFSVSSLFGLFGLVDNNARIDVLGPGQLLFDQLEIRQTLEETRLGGPGPEVGPLIRTRGDWLDRQPSYSPDGIFVVYTSNQNGNMDLFVTTRDGRTKQLTNDSQQDWDPAFTPDGQHVVWSSDREDNLEIWKAGFNADTLELSTRYQVSKDTFDAQNPTVTDDDWVVYATANPDGPGVWKVKLNGSHQQKLVPGAQLSIPDVSPDGRYALFLDSSQDLRASIRVVEIATGECSPFEIAFDYVRDESNADITMGRARWTAKETIMFVGQNEDFEVGIFEQDFPDQENTVSSVEHCRSPKPGAAAALEDTPDNPTLEDNGRDARLPLVPIICETTSVVRLV